jgi:hypothetical protein
MAALTDLDVANIVASMLTEGRIPSLEADTKAARLISLHLDMHREIELQANAWTFALIRLDSDPEDTTIVGPTRYRHSRPDDSLRVLPLMDQGFPHGQNVPYTEYADGLYTSGNSTVPFVYIGNIIDPSQMPATFVNVWAASVAMAIAHALTQKSGMVQMAQGYYEKAIATARRSNAIQRGFQIPPQSISEARGDPKAALREHRG